MPSAALPTAWVMASVLVSGCGIAFHTAFALGYSVLVELAERAVVLLAASSGV